MRPDARRVMRQAGMARFAISDAVAGPAEPTTPATASPRQRRRPGGDARHERPLKLALFGFIIAAALALRFRLQTRGAEFVSALHIYIFSPPPGRYERRFDACCARRIFSRARRWALFWHDDMSNAYFMRWACLDVDFTPELRAPLIIAVEG